MMIFFTGNMHAADKYTLNNECSIVVLWLGEPQTMRMFQWQVLVDYVLICRNPYIVLLLWHKFF